jgi:hypothetical protein
MNTASITIQRYAQPEGALDRAANAIGTALVAWSRRRQLPVDDAVLAQRHEHLRAVEREIQRHDTVVHPLAR